jgi:hypothetical protein
MATFKSKYVTLRKHPYHRVWHDTISAPQAKAGFCTVVGSIENPHRAAFSLFVRDSKGNECWLAACKDHVPPMAVKAEEN